ncbi:MAG: DUF1080 domain-containing protein [Isosphaeraceae bacterium]
MTHAKPSRRSALGLAAVVALTLAAPAPRAEDPPKSQEGWISLFNGKDLTGWTPKIRYHAAGEDPYDTFRVEDGVLKVSYDKYPKFDDKFGHLFSKNKYSRYRLRIEYRFVGEQCPGGPGWALRNSGVMVHSQSVESMGKDQDFPVSIEVQFLGGAERGERPTGSLCTPGTHVVMDGKLIKTHCITSTSKTYRGDVWVTAEAEVHGDGKITHFINGEPVITYEKPQLDDSSPDSRELLRQGAEKMVREGYLALQAESHPIEFRKVEILPLDE